MKIVTLAIILASLHSFTLYNVILASPMHPGSKRHGGPKDVPDYDSPVHDHAQAEHIYNPNNPSNQASSSSYHPSFPFLDHFDYSPHHQFDYDAYGNHQHPQFEWQHPERGRQGSNLLHGQSVDNSALFGVMNIGEASHLHMPHQEHDSTQKTPFILNSLSPFNDPEETFGQIYDQDQDDDIFYEAATQQVHDERNTISYEFEDGRSSLLNQYDWQKKIPQADLLRFYVVCATIWSPASFSTNKHAFYNLNNLISTHENLVSGLINGDQALIEQMAKNAKTPPEYSRASSNSKIQSIRQFVAWIAAGKRPTTKDVSKLVGDNSVRASYLPAHVSREDQNKVVNALVQAWGITPNATKERLRKVGKDLFEKNVDSLLVDNEEMQKKIAEQMWEDAKKAHKESRPKKARKTKG